MLIYTVGEKDVSKEEVLKLAEGSYLTQFPAKWLVFLFIYFTLFLPQRSTLTFFDDLPGELVITRTIHADLLCTEVDIGWFPRVILAAEEKLQQFLAF